MRVGLFRKIEKIVFYVLIFSIPFQTRIILFQKNPFSEWNGIYFYFTDLLLGLVFVLWLLRSRSTRMTTQINADKKKWVIDFNIIKCRPEFILIIFFIVAGLSLFGVQNLGVGVFRWIKLGEFILLFLYIKSNLRLFDLKRIFQFLVASGVFQSLIAISQFFSQSDLGLKHFEAGPLGPNIVGAAKIVVDGAKMLRAYGTFPHPNVLAAFLLAAIFCFYYLFFANKHKFTTNDANRKFHKLKKGVILSPSTLLRVNSTKNPINFRKRFFGLCPQNDKKYIYSLWFTIYGLLVFALFLTFSRAAIFAFGAGSILLFLFIVWKAKSNQSQIRILTGILILFIVYSSLFIIILWPELYSRVYFTGESENLALRSFYNQSALSMIKNSPFLGIGIGNFVKNLEFQVSSFKFQEWIFQPVHNLYLLVVSEIGLIGLAVFLLFVVLFFKKAFARIRTKLESNSDGNSHISLLITYYLLLITFVFLFLAFFDHYFWTLQQGGLIFWIILGILAASKKTR